MSERDVVGKKDLKWIDAVESAARAPVADRAVRLNKLGRGVANAVAWNRMERQRGGLLLNLIEIVKRVNSGEVLRPRQGK